MLGMDGTCAHCGATYSRPPSLLGRYCSKRCAYDARRKERTNHRRMRFAPAHPLAGKTGLVSEARAVLYDRLGPGPHACHWCGTTVDWVVGARGNIPTALVADHVNSDPLDDRPENIVPACGACNATRGAVVADDDLYVTRANGTRLRAVRRECEHCHGQFLAAVNQVAAGRGRFCSKSCARKHQWAQTRPA